MDNFEKYEPKLPYPNKHDYITTYYYHRGRCVAREVPGELPVAEGTSILMEREKLAHCIVEKALDEVAYETARQAYRDEQNRLMKQFEIDLYVDLGITRNKKRFDLYAKAWDRGHAHGYSEIYAVACDLVDLIKN